MKLRELKCRHGCKSPVAGLFYAPDGCLCFPDKVQALCTQHAIKGMQNNEMYELIMDGQQRQLQLDGL